MSRAIHRLTCDTCRAGFDAVNGYAQTCSATCRSRLRRDRTAARHARLAAQADAAIASGDVAAIERAARAIADALV